MRLLLLFIFLSFTAHGQRLVSHYKPKVKGNVYNIIRHTVDKNGNLLVIGTIDHIDGDYSGSLVKLNSLGKVESSFQKVITDSPIYEVKVSADDKIFIAGPFNMINGNPTNNLVMLSQNGTVENNFTSELDNVSNFAFQSDGKIIVVGSFSGYKGYNNVARLNSDGTVDETFNKLIFNTSSYLLAVASDDAIYFNDFTKVIKLNSSGGLESNFDTGLGTENTGTLYSIEVNSQGAPIIAGTFTKFNGTSAKSIALLNQNGSVNLDFNQNIGAGPQGAIYSIIIEENNKILIGGQFTSYGNQPASLVELNADGSFNKIIANISPNDIQRIAISDANKISIVGSFKTVNSQEHGNIALFNSDFTIDSQFSPEISETTANGRIMEVNSSGNVFTGGGMGFEGVYDGVFPHRTPLARLNGLGTIDTDYQPAIFPTVSVMKSAIQEDDKILLSVFSPSSYLIRLNTDGAMDQTFNTGTGPKSGGVPSFATSIKQRGDHIYVSAPMDIFNTTPSNGLIALNLDGSISQSFLSIPSNSYLYDFDFQSDGKVILIGYIPINNETFQIIRLNQNGSIDNTFNSLAFQGNPRQIKIDENDNIIFCGDLYTVGGALVSGVVKLLPGGGIDTNFNTGLGFQNFNQVTSIEILPTGNIAVGGPFEKYNGQLVNGFAIIDGTGQRIATPDIQFGPRTNITGIRYHTGALYISGRMTTPSQTEIFGVGKISFSNDPPPAAPDQLSVSLISPGNFEITWADNSTNEIGFVLERSEILDNGFLPIKSISANNVLSTDNNIESNTTYYYRIKAVNDAGESDYSQVVSQTWIIPSPPSALLATQNLVGQVFLTWSDNSSNEDSFIIERSTNNDSNFQPVGSTSSDLEEFTDLVQPNQLYFYRVVASSATRGPSDYSNIVSITTIYLPAAPSNLSVQQLTANALTLSWVENSNNEEGFMIERSIGSPTNFSNIGIVGIDGNTFIDMDIVQQTIYFYRVFAFHFGGQSGYSNSATILSLYPPIAPTQLSVKQSKIDEVTLTWRDNSENEAGFIIEKSTDGINFIESGQANANTQIFKDSVGPPDSFYVYRIKSFNLVGESTYSETAQLDVILGADNTVYNPDIFPNPASDFIYVSNNAKSPKTEWKLINVLGQEHLIHCTTTEEYEIIDVRGVPNGFYLLQKSNSSLKPTRVLINK